MSTKKAKPKSKVSNRLADSKPVKPPAVEATPYKIESGVPIEGVRTITNFNNFPFEQMKIGDSFIIPPGDKFAENPNSIHYAANRYAKMKPGFCVTTRLQLNKYRRVWRIK
jgi:hypothetical protein